MPPSTRPTAEDEYTCRRDVVPSDGDDGAIDVATTTTTTTTTTTATTTTANRTTTIVVLPTILRMPIETVLHLASSYLRPCDVRSLACTCQRMRYALLHDEGASNFLWMARLVESFPDVLRRRAVAVDSRRRDRDRALPLLLQGAPPPGIVVPTLDVDVAKDLHLLTSMLPGRYPRVIDLGGASSSSETEEADDDDGRPSSLAPFVSYEVESSSITPEVDAIPPNANATATDVAPVRLVKFVGRVGTGNRSMRSDAPFPAPAACGGGGRVGRTSSSDEKRKKKKRGRLLVKSLGGMFPSWWPASTTNGNDAARRGRRPEDDDDDDDDGDGDPAVATYDRRGPRTALVDRVIRRRRRRVPPTSRGTVAGMLRPFVVPIVVVDDGCYAIDLTPRLVAYYEVSIVVVGRDRCVDDDVVASSSSSTVRDGPSSSSAIAPRECVSIGLSTEAYRVMDNMPGWDAMSYGYHSDDGGIFHGARMDRRSSSTASSSRQYRRSTRPTYGPGDVVGCGYDYVARRIFFTRNGIFLGYEFDVVDADVVEGGLFPTVGVDTDCPIYVNFGERPFRFDLRNM